MKRTLITSLLMACLTGASAQETTPIDRLFDQLEDILGTTKRLTKGNYGRGTTIDASCYVHGGEFCSKEVCGHGPDNGNAEVMEKANRVAVQRFDRALAAIRHCLDSISALPNVEESYHLETHQHGIDTIQYSICLTSGGNPNRLIDKRQHGYNASYSDMPGAEIIKFYCNTVVKPCGQHVSEDGYLQYKYIKKMGDSFKDTTFEWEKFLQTITPLLNQRGITQRKINWVREEAATDSLGSDYIASMSMTLEDGTVTTAGETSGTVYFIPSDRQALAESVLSGVKAALESHIDTYPEQGYQYNYNVEFVPIADPDITREKQLFRTTFWGDYELVPNDHQIYVGTDIYGYYILVLDTKGCMWLPREWSRLKSFVNGKKTYHKGLKPLGAKPGILRRSSPLHLRL